MFRRKGINGDGGGGVEEEKLCTTGMYIRKTGREGGREVGGREGGREGGWRYGGRKKPVRKG